MSRMYQAAEILEVKPLSNRVKVFSIGLKEGMKADPGQYIKVKTPEGKADYTLISPITEEQRLVFAVDNHPDSKVGKYLHSLGSGEELEIKGPYGHFTIDPNGQKMVMIAYTIGITPLLANLRHLYNLEYSGKIHLYHIIPDGFDNVFNEDIRSLTKVLDLSYEIINSDVVKNKYLIRGKFKKKTVKKLFEGHPNANFYLAGKSKIIKKLAKKLNKLKDEPNMIKLEKF